MNSDEIKRIAHLARIELTPAEALAFTPEISGILSYIDQIKEITGDAPEEKVVGALYNVMREDTNPHEPGLYTEDLLREAPEREGAYVKVKKILDQNT